MWVVIPYPRFRAKNRFIKIESEEQFEEIIHEKIYSISWLIEYVESAHKNGHNHKLDKQELAKLGYQYKDKNMVFVEFYAEWVLPCQFVIL